MLFKLKKTHKKSLLLFVFVAILGLLVGVNYAYADFYGWTSQNSYYISTGWSSIASSGDGSRLVAVRSDLDNYVYVSNDYGASWTARDAAGTLKSWASVAINAYGNKIIASTHEGNIYYSTDDGVSWTDSNLGNSGLDFSSIAIGDEYAYATAFNGKIWRASVESLNIWNILDTSDIRGWNSIATSDDGTKVVAVPNNGYIYTSANGGSSWQVRTNSGSGFARQWQSVAMSSDGQTIVAVENDGAVVGAMGHVYKSTDMGESWTTLSGAGSRKWSAVSISDDGELIVAATLNDGGVYASFNGGSTWTAEESAGNGLVRSLALTTSGNRVALASSDSYIYTALEQTETIITNVTSSIEDGTYIAGDIIPIQVTFSAPVFVGGTPGLSLNTSVNAPYVSGSGSSTLTFRYTVGASDETSDLDYSDTSPFQFSGGAFIRDRFDDSPIFNVPSPGSSGSLGANKDIVIDTTPLDAPGSFALSADSDTGVSNSDGITSPGLVYGYTLTFSASCNDDASVVSIKDNASIVATTTCSAGTATWTVSGSFLPGGYYSLGATQTDSSGNESDPSSTFDLVLDSSAPALSNITPEDSTGIASVTDGSITYTIEEDNPYEGTITITETGGSADGFSPHTCYLNSNKLVTNSHAIDLSSDCSTDNSNLSAGSTYSFQFSMVDYAGNSTTVQRTDINYGPDVTGPTISEVTPVPSSTGETTPGYTFTSDEAGTITYGGSCSSATTDASEGENIITFDTLAEGEYTDCTITVTDGAANVSNTLYVSSFTVDTTPPDAPDTAPDLAEGSDSGVSNEDNITNDNTPTFTGACIDTDTVYLYSDGSQVGSYTCSLETSYNVTSSSLTAGGHDMSIVFYDPAGNSSDSSPVLSIVIDTTAPTTSGAPDLTSDSGVSSSDNITSGSNQTFAGSCTNGNTVQLYDDGASSGSSAACSGGAFSLTSGTLATGVNAITFKETDTAGNTSTASTPLSVTIDTTAPTISSVSSDKANGTYTVGEVIDIDVTFSESVQSAGNVTVTLETGTTDRTCTFSVSSATTGTCNYTVEEGDSALDLTVSSISGTIRDIAGNSLSNFTPATNLAVNKAISIDTTSPTISEVTPISSGTDTTPDYTFTTNEAGTITYGGSCSSVTSSATLGSNTITLDALTVGTYADCTIVVTDDASNSSNTLTITSFTISTISVPSTTNATKSGSVQTRITTPLFTPTTPDTPLPKVCNVGDLFNINTGLPCSSIVNDLPPGCFTGFNFSILTGESCKDTTTENPSAPTTPNTTPTPPTPLFTKNLELGDIDPEVKLLQIFLNNNGFIVSTVGNGRPGFEINRFGPGTVSALIRFQKANSIAPAVGYFGPKTRGYINSL